MNTTKKKRKHSVPRLAQTISTLSAGLFCKLSFVKISTFQWIVLAWTKWHFQSEQHAASGSFPLGLVPPPIILAIFVATLSAPPLPFQLGPDVPGEQPTPGAAQDESMGFSVRGWKFGACCSHLSTACCVQEGSREPSIDAVTTAVNVVAMKVNEMSQLGPTELFNPPSLGMVSPL